MSELSPERRFNTAIHELYGRIVRESGYTPTIFFRMIEEHGGLRAAHRLLKPDADFFSYGFEHLCKMRRDDLTMEHSFSRSITGLSFSRQMNWRPPRSA